VIISTFSSSANSEHGGVRSVVSEGVVATPASEKRVDLRCSGSGKEPVGGGTKSDGDDTEENR
jgi:hypothetical protein